MRMIRNGKFTDKKILLIDKEPKTKNDRTWCFWEKEKGFFEDIVCKKWSKLSFLSDEYSDTMDISPYQYKLIRGIDFYNYCFDEIKKHSNIDLFYGTVTSVICDKKAISIKIDNATHYFDHTTLFNSFPPKKETANQKQGKEINLLQHFKGWVIETPGPAFDPGRATFMDFRVDQQRGTTFVYVLPFSKTKALVEYTLFTDNILANDEYEMELATYIRNFLKIDDYKIEEKEFGIIPMTNRKFKIFTDYMYYIGTAGGQTKASTGYTFQFIQKQSEQILDCLISKKQLSGIQPNAPRFFFYDKVLLDVLYNHRASGKKVFTTMFRKNKPQQILKFLDNESSLVEEIKIISTLPTLPFLKAAKNQL